MEEPVAYAILGISPRRALDEAYRAFIETYRNTLISALSAVVAYEQEQKRAEALAEIDRAKTTFFSNISHELRTPLTLMLGPLEDLVEQSAGENRASLDMIFRNGKRLLKLVNTILDFSRIEAGRMKSRYKATALASYSRDLASLFRSAVERAGLEFKLEAGEFSEPVYIDREMWERVILNLLSNAVKYTKTGSIRLSFEETDTEVAILVSDTGIGIPESDLPKLFDRFHRVEGAQGRTHEGTGIGLSLVQELVKLQGGVIEVQSRLGNGSRFVVRLPKGKKHVDPDRIDSESSFSTKSHLYLEEVESWLRSDEDLLVPTDPAPDAPWLSPSHDFRILVADDNSDMRAYVKSLLSPYWIVDTAANGKEALEKLKTESYQLLLSDVMMPELDGFQLLAAVRGDSKIAKLQVILLSARAGEEAKVEGLAAGADDYLIKPFSAKELLARVTAMLQLSQSRTEAAQLLEKSEERLRSTFAHASVGMVLLSPDGHFLEVNEAFCQILGRTEGELVGQHFAPFNHPDELPSSINLIHDLVNGKRSEATILKQLLHKSGEMRWVENNLSVLKDESGYVQFIIIICQDISERKAADDRVKAAQRQAEEANKAKTLFLANMSHEIRTPLGIIKGYAELMNEADAKAEEKQKWLEIIASNTEHLGFLIDDILDLSKVEANQIEARKEMFSLSRLVGDIADGMTLKAQQKGIHFSVEANLSPSDVVFSDSFRIRQILSNIIGNAIKFTDQGSVRVTYGLSEGSRGRVAEFRVQDTGIGLTAEQSQRLFQSFSQADNSISRRFGGTGLGLAISRRLAQILGGDLILESSTLGQGATFKLTLPMDAPQTKPKAPRSPAEQELSEAPQLASLHVLLVEDSPDIRLLVSRILKIGGITQVTQAANGYEALEYCARNSFDAVLLDVQMPGIDGFETVRRLRESGFRQPVIALTAHAMQGYREECLAAGYDDYLVKPIDRAQLLGRLQKLTQTAAHE